MKFAMLEPLFIEFADECLKVVETDENKRTKNSIESWRAIKSGFFDDLRKRL